MNLCAASLILIACAPALAQDTVPVFHATSDLVLVDVQVLRKKTRTAAPAIQRSDLRVYEDDAEQAILFFSRDELPLSIVFLFDLTESDRPILKGLAAGARTALAHLKPEDEVAVMDYAATAYLVDGFTKDRARTAAAIHAAARSRKPQEAAFFNEAVWQAVAELNRGANPAGRRVVIWLTDNYANVPAPRIVKHFGKGMTMDRLHSERQAIQALHESGTVVAPLIRKSRVMLPFIALELAAEKPLARRYPPGDVYKYAELTGGEALKLGRRSVEERLGQLIDELRSRYTIGYKPSAGKPAGSFCRLRVILAPEGSLRPEEWDVLATAGYYRM